MLEIFEKERCCGCGVCADACTHQAITFTEDHEGFLYPKVDKEKCADCGACESICPVLNINSLKRTDDMKQKAFAAINKRIGTRFESSAGGVFSALANKMYKDGGYVGGAVYDDNQNVTEFVSNDKGDLKKIQGAKFVQSYSVGFYKKVKDLLVAGEKVLVCGTPCQTAAIKSFLNKDYSNLLLVDFVCRGVNSPKFYHKLESELEEKYGSKIVYQTSLNKEMGWDSMTHKYIFSKKKSEYLYGSNNVLKKAYLDNNILSRPSCYDCQFKGLKRFSDITLGAYTDKLNTITNDNLGCSLVLLNSSKGEVFFSAIQTKINKEEADLSKVIEMAPMLTESLPKPKCNRNEFYNQLDSLSIKDLADKFLSNARTHNIFLSSLKPFAKIIKYSEWSLFNLFRLVRLNFFKKNIETNIKKDALFYFSKNVIMNIAPTAQIKLDALLEIGHRRYKQSKQETRLLVDDHAVLEVKTKTFWGYGSDIELLIGGHLVIKSDMGGELECQTNEGLTIVCRDYIEIGEDCRIGRNVTLRDSNGGHYMSLDGYKTSRPIIIGKHVWLCDGCTVMSGVKIGDGAIIAANATVYSNVPPNSIAVGNPAVVLEENVYWKY